MMIGPDGQVRRSCSGRLRVPGKSEPNHVELFASLREQYGEKAIVAIQPFGMGRFELLFESERELNTAVEKGLLFGGARQDIEPVDSEVKWLYIKYAPFELEKKDLETCLAPYGEIKSMEFVYPEEMRPWHNGERKVKFVMKRAVPNFLKVGVYTIHVHYAGVVKLCRKCHSNDHMARDCNNNNCRKCGKPGHVEVDCGRGSEDIESPLAIMKMAEKARDDLLKNLRVSREDLAKRPLTLENPEDEDEDEKTETDDTQDNEGDNSEHGTEESMPELEEEEDLPEDDPEQNTDEEPEETGYHQDLERKKYLKDYGENKEEDPRKTDTKGKNKKKMSKQERKKRRLLEEKERNKKREREESKSPTRERPKQNEELIEEIEKPREGSEEDNETKEEKVKTENRRRPIYWMIFKWTDMTFGRLKELLSVNFGLEKVIEIDTKDNQKWRIRFSEERWARQVLLTGIRDGSKIWFPTAATKGRNEEEIKVIIKERNEDTS